MGPKKRSARTFVVCNGCAVRRPSKDRIDQIIKSQASNDRIVEAWNGDDANKIRQDIADAIAIYIDTELRITRKRRSL